MILPEVAVLFAPRRTVVAVDGTFSGQTPGAATLPAGMSTVRSGTANAPDEGASPPYVFGVAANTGRVAKINGYTGLLVEKAAANLWSGHNPRAQQSWTGAPTGTTTGNAADGIDGTHVASHNVCAAGTYGRFSSSELSALVVGRRYVQSCFIQKSAKVNWSINVYDGVALHASWGSDLTTSLVRKKIVFTAQGTGVSIQAADGRNLTGLGGAPAMDLDCNVDAQMLEANTTTPSSYIDTTRGAEGHNLTAASSVVSGGRIRFYFKMLMRDAIGDCPDGARVWTIDANTHCHVNINHGTIVGVVDGYPIELPLPAWSGDWTDLLEVYIEIGNGAMLGWTTLNGGARTTIGPSSDTHDPIFPESASLGLFCDHTTSTPSLQLEGVANFLFYTRGAAGTTAARRKLYVSATGSGDGLSFGAPMSLAAAQTAIQTYVATGTGLPVRVYLLDTGGAYDLSAAPLALVHGVDFSAAVPVRWVAYPTHVPEWSCEQNVTTGWTLDSGSVYKRSVTAGTRSRGLAANGVRLTRARSANQAGWTASYAAGTLTFTASDSAIAGYADPTVVELVGKRDWKMYRGYVASAVTNQVVVSNPAGARSQDQASEEWASVAWYEGARELVTTAGYWCLNANTLYLYPPVGHVVNTTSVRLAIAETIVTITGTLASKANGLSIVGVKMAGTTWANNTDSPEAVGYTPVQSSVLGTATGTPSVFLKGAAAVKLSACGSGVELRALTFTRIGGDGISALNGSGGARVIACLFSDVSGHGISDGDVTHAIDAQQTDSRALNGLFVYSCTFDGVGVEYSDCCGIWRGYVTNAITRQSTFANCPWSAEARGWGWGASNWITSVAQPPAPIQGGGEWTCNRVNSYGQVLVDDGGLYLLNVQTGLTVSANYVYHPTLGPTYPFYLDGGSAGITVSGNVSDNVGGNYWANLAALLIPAWGTYSYAHDNVMTGNYADSGFVNGNAGGTNNTVSGNTVGALGAAALAIKAASGRL